LHGSFEFIEKTVLVVFQDKISLFVGEKGHKDNSAGDLVLRVDSLSEFRDDVPVFFNLRLLVLFELVVGVIPGFFGGSVMSLLSVLDHVRGNFVLELIALLMYFDQLVVRKLPLVEIKGLAFVVLDHLNVIDLDAGREILLFLGLEIGIELFLQRRTLETSRHVLDYDAEIRDPQSLLESVLDSADLPFDPDEEEEPDDQHGYS
jgi:hypothetical protein